MTQTSQRQKRESVVPTIMWGPLHMQKGGDVIPAIHQPGARTSAARSNPGGGVEYSERMEPSAEGKTVARRLGEQRMAFVQVRHERL